MSKGVFLAEFPSLVPVASGAAIANASGQVRRIGIEEARSLFRSGDVLVVHAAFIAGRLKVPPAKPLFDVLELMAFLRPAQPVIPSPLGLARILMLPAPHAAEDGASVLHAAANLLLEELRGKPEAERARLRSLATTMGRMGWRWSPLILDAIGQPEHALPPIAGFDVWARLPEWEDSAAPAKPGTQAVSPEEARARLSQLVGSAGEQRPEQAEYTESASYAFAPRERPGAPRVALIEAGTGVGKTLGYLAPASLWSERNGPGLWISTYTRNLQRQIVQEIARVYPDPVERDEKVVVRKGRENYLCLLNFEEAAKRTALAPGQRAVALGLMARWIAATSDGDLSGAGFPAFLAASYPLGEITDRRGECVYAACPHYRRCFIERAIRRARHAPIVIANHALVIAQAMADWTGTDDEDAPDTRHARYVFDEGHHVFDAADSGFSALLSGREMADLRRWIRGPEGRARTRMRGLEERLKDIIEGDDEARSALDEAVAASGALAAEGWLSGLHGGGGIRGAGETFLAAAYSHVLARTDQDDRVYSLEAETEPLGPDIVDAARKLAGSLKRIAVPLARLAQTLRKQLDDEAADLESHERQRIEAAARGLDRRAKLILPAWIAMLDALETGEGHEQFVDWFEIEREDGRDMDVGLRRHWIDPTIPFAAEVLIPSHGALITSATLRDSDPGIDDWQSAEIRTAAAHLPEPPKRALFGSPFRYADQARVFVVKDVNRRDADQLAAAYRELFVASGGGALGLFTAVRSLRAVQSRIAEPLEEAGIPVYAQHVDRLDTGTLVDLFRAEENACLLGTDALRDGVDVPGRSLRLVVFDKVPWPKPTILHKARRARFGKTYDDLLTRFRLKQAFGRLIRGAGDKGCFVILEPATPSRLLTAFPPDVPVSRCGFAEVIAEIREFLRESR
ncbi:MAG TPA: ATP-dependent DNA helicase [Rhizomicrobium sp.]|jgi:ATP-dependent DNA helicase DinG